MSKPSALSREQKVKEKVTLVVMPTYGTPSFKSLSKIPVEKRTFVAQPTDEETLYIALNKAIEKAKALMNKHQGAWIKKTTKSRTIIHSL